MNLRTQLMAEISRRNTDYIAHAIGNDLQQFDELMQIVFAGESPLSMRAAWVVTAVTDKYPGMLTPYLEKVVDEIETFNHAGTRRNMLRYISAMSDIPEALQGKLYDICWRWMLSIHEPPAVRALSMRILYNIARNEPDLLQELRLMLGEFNAAEKPAIKSVCRQLLKKI